MNFLVIDGNSIINRAFYGIKLLTAKDGHYTNAIYGFFNIFLSLCDTVKPEAVAVAFDVKQPTFRHEMYSEYKAGRKGMPAELFEQLEPVKELMRAYGCHVIECPGYEADDILGTLSFNCKGDNHCYIATGDRDSLQLVSDNTTVLLAATRMGKPQTIEYTPASLKEEYGLTPSQMIELKALQGDSSDNIPGVAGIGPKTASQLITEYANIDNIFADIDALNVTENVKNKLRNGRDSAYLSKKLGTICVSAPIAADSSDYYLKKKDSALLRTLLGKHEMFKLLSRLDLKNEVTATQDSTVKNVKALPLHLAGNVSVNELTEDGKAYFVFYMENKQLSAVVFCTENCLYGIDSGNLEFLPLLCSVFSNNKIKKYTHNVKELYLFCENNGITLNNVKGDTALSAYLLNPNASDYSISASCAEHNIPACEISTETESEKAFYVAHRLLTADASMLMTLSNRLNALIETNSQYKLLTEIELPLSQVLASMEHEGMMVDKEGIEKYGEKMSESIDALAAEIYTLADDKFNINSPKQLGDILFGTLQIPTKKKTKSGYSTSADVLESLADEYPIVAKVLEYRTYSKLKSTYCDGLLKTIDDDMRIRSTFRQTETRTGRLSSTEPNLQNIPVRTPLGREMRKFFRAKDGYVIVDADYSQIELRVLAAISDDKNMIEAFNNGSDIHAITASKVFGVELENVSASLRSKAKAVNFGIVYGIGAFSLAKDIHSTRAEAESFIKAYLSLYSGINNYMQTCIDKAKENGYVETLLHRRRYLPELKASNGMIRSFGERVARNMPIQGTAADIIKIAMIKVYNRLKAEYPDSALIMQVHDELMIEAPEKDAQKVSALLKEEMENAVRLSVKLSVDVSYGKTWYDAKC